MVLRRQAFAARQAHNNLLPHIIMNDVDFSENMDFKLRDEIQSAHWCGVGSATLFICGWCGLSHVNVAAGVTGNNVYHAVLPYADASVLTFVYKTQERVDTAFCEVQCRRMKEWVLDAQNSHNAYSAQLTSVGPLQGERDCPHYRGAPRYTRLIVEGLYIDAELAEEEDLADAGV
jgi:hypothetical protein